MWFGLALVLVAIILFGLRKLETKPYRPPYDMSTLLGGPELAFVRAMTVLFAVVWCVLLVGFAVRFWPPGLLHNVGPLYRPRTSLVNDEQKPLDYAEAALNKPSPATDFLLLGAIGTIFGIAFLALLFWWILFR